MQKKKKLAFVLYADIIASLTQQLVSLCPLHFYKSLLITYFGF